MKTFPKRVQSIISRNFCRLTLRGRRLSLPRIEIGRIDKELHLSEEVRDDVDIVEEGEEGQEHHHAVPQQDGALRVAPAGVQSATEVTSEFVGIFKKGNTKFSSLQAPRGKANPN